MLATLATAYIYIYIVQHDELCAEVLFCSATVITFDGSVEAMANLLEQELEDEINKLRLLEKESEKREKVRKNHKESKSSQSKYTKSNNNLSINRNSLAVVVHDDDNSIFIEGEGRRSISRKEI